MPIPARVHFCWIGPTLPWVYAFAVLSAAAQGDLNEVILHHTDELEDGPALTALRAAPIRLHRLDPHTLLAEAGQRIGKNTALSALYDTLQTPVQRVDVLRAAILYLQGGIYLDLDTITVASLRPLLAATQFIGTEYIVWPQSVRTSRAPKTLARHLALDVLRKALRAAPAGWRAFRGVEHWYFKGANNAVMGAEPTAPLFAAYLHAMLALPPAQCTQPYALGPDLLQNLIATFPPDQLTIHEPAAFYPLAPEISDHWFRPCTPKLEKILRPQTRVVHWYASIRSKPEIARIDPAYIRAYRHHQLYSALVSRALPQF